MKARIKTTGEIINIADYATVTLDMCDTFGNPIEKSFEEVEILQEKTSDDGIDWEQRRYEIARELMKANLDTYATREHLVKWCVESADALIVELKKRNTKNKEDKL